MKQYNKGASFIGVVVGIIIAALVLWGIFALGKFLFFTTYMTPSTGQHTGIVTSVEQTGFWFHTWKAYVKTSATATQEDQYCVIDPAVVTQLQDAATAVKEVTIKYSNPAFIPASQCKSSDESIIRSVQ